MKKKALITGGSSGIGFELSRLFAHDGYDLFIVSKPQEELDQAENRLRQEFTAVEIKTLAMDLSENGAAKNLFGYTQEQEMDIDVLVNNAGFGTYGYIQTIDPEREMEMIRLNVLCTYELTRLFARKMDEGNGGRILNVSSISAFQPSPYLATYGATKAFVHTFSRAINFELKQMKSKVRITTVCPTPAKTNFGQVASMEGSALFESWLVSTPQTIARDAYKALNKGKEMVVPNPFYHLLSSLFRLLPMRFLIWYTSTETKPIMKP